MTFVKFERILPRNPDIIAHELCFILQRWELIACELPRLVNEGLISETCFHHIIGAFEFAVAEALARLLNVALYVKSSRGVYKHIPERRYILWNGHLQHDDVPMFTMSGPGLPDIEIHYDEQCILVEVTLGVSVQTIMRELREIISHKPIVLSRIDRRVLITPLYGKHLNEVQDFISSNYGDEIQLLSIYTLIEYLFENRNVNIGDLFNFCTLDYGHTLHYCRNIVRNLEKYFESIIREERYLDNITQRILRERGYVVLAAMMHELGNILKSGSSTSLLT